MTCFSSRFLFFGFKSFRASVHVDGARCGIRDRAPVLCQAGEFHFDAAARLAIERNGCTALNSRPGDGLQLVTEAGGHKGWQREPRHCRESRQGKGRFRRRSCVGVLRDSRGIRFKRD